jgi:hypothetical protein
MPAIGSALKMCRSLQARVPEYLAPIREALHNQDASR